MVNFTPPAAVPPAKEPLYTFICRTDKRRGRPAAGIRFEIVEAVLRHSAVLGSIWNVQIAGHFPLRLLSAHNSSMTSFAEQSQQMPAIRDGVKSISWYISAIRNGEKVIRLTAKVNLQVQ